MSHLENVALSVRIRRPRARCSDLDRKWTPSDHQELGDLLADKAIVDPRANEDRQARLDLREALACLVLPGHSLTSNRFSTRSSSRKAEKKDHHQTHLLTCKRRSDLLDLEALLACVAHQVHRVSWALKVTLETQDLQDQLAQWDLVAYQDCQEKKEFLAKMVSLDLQDLMDHLVVEVFLECLEFQALRVIEVFLD